MTPLSFTLITFCAALVAGLMGALMGIGGGIIITPVLTLLLGVDIRFAFGASIVGVIATSSGSAAAYVKQHMTNLRVAVLLQLGTAAGAVTGAMLVSIAPKRTLFILFGLSMAFTAYMMLRKRFNPRDKVPTDPFADRLRLHDHYYDQDAREEVFYHVTRSRIGLGLMYIGGILSGLLGIGSGAIAVPTLSIMRLPFKVCTATSNFMMGVTAAASAGIYFARGWIDPFVTAPVALGVFCGAVIGTRIMPRISSRIIRVIFVTIIVVISAQMLQKGLSAEKPAPPHTDPSASESTTPSAPATLLKGTQP